MSSSLPTGLTKLKWFSLPLIYPICPYKSIPSNDINAKAKELRARELPSDAFAIFIEAYACDIKDDGINKIKYLPMMRNNSCWIVRLLKFLNPLIKLFLCLNPSAPIMLLNILRLSNTLSRKKRYFQFLKYFDDIQKHIHTTNTVENLHSKFEIIRLNGGGYFQSLKTAEIALSIAINTTTANKWSKPLNDFITCRYEILQLFNTKLFSQTQFFR